MKKFNEFKETVAAEIRNYLSEEFAGADVSIQEVIKNNDTVRIGLSVRKEGSAVAPSVYLEDFFKRYEDGEALEGLLAEIAKTVKGGYENFPSANFNVDNVTNWNLVKGKIVPRLINKNYNKNRLKEVPFTVVDGDLAVIYTILLNEDASATITITDSLIKGYGVDVATLHEVAMGNMEKLTPLSFNPISYVLASMICSDFNELSEEEQQEQLHAMGLDQTDCAMYVLTNKQKIFGAAWILDTATMKMIKRKLKNFLVIPSSVHEVLIVNADDVSAINQMICEVNATQVSPDEVLSDHAYRFDEITETIVSVNSSAPAEGFADVAREVETEEKSSLVVKLGTQ